MNGGKLSPKSDRVDHLLDGTAHLLFSHFSSAQDIFDGIFTLVAFCRAASAIFQNFDEDINITAKAKEGIFVKEEHTLKRIYIIVKALQIVLVDLSGKHNVPV